MTYKEKYILRLKPKKLLVNAKWYVSIANFNLIFDISINIFHYTLSVQSLTDLLLTAKQLKFTAKQISFWAPGVAHLHSNLMPTITSD